MHFVDVMDAELTTTNVYILLHHIMSRNNNNNNNINKYCVIDFKVDSVLKLYYS